MPDSDRRNSRIRELVGVLELAAAEHRSASTALAAKVQRDRWYSALRELAELRRQSATGAEAPRATSAAARSST